MLPIPSFFSLVTLWETYLRRCFTASGLSPRAVEVDSETKTIIHFWGPAKPSLVLVHGFGPIAIWQWRKQVQFFAPHFNVYVPDLLFFGGFVAYRMAEMWPEKVDKVVIASSGLNLRKRDNEGLLKRAGLEKIEELMLPTNPGQLRTLVDLAVFKRLNMAPNFLLIDIINKLYSENRKEKMELLKGVTLGKDDNPHISRLQQEVLLLWGEHDQLFPLEMATELKQLLGEKVKLEVMKNTSHVPQIEAPLRFNNIVKMPCDTI
ncbi:hypothetical protein CRG98_003554 [Punica granatum]|uniref:AB hydrolase-1 domain-containing protein n=1 Tax=Punica granatum TaxID=22663 RepID=A0A2I0L5M7_PUNGR|nr:hypothetical protein CRG98_003554 [Punica granatum]